VFQRSLAPRYVGKREGARCGTTAQRFSSLADCRRISAFRERLEVALKWSSPTNQARLPAKLARGPSPLTNRGASEVTTGSSYGSKVVRICQWKSAIPSCAVLDLLAQVSNGEIVFFGTGQRAKTVVGEGLVREVEHRYARHLCIREGLGPVSGRMQDPTALEECCLMKQATFLKG